MSVESEACCRRWESSAMGAGAVEASSVGLEEDRSEVEVARAKNDDASLSDMKVSENMTSYCSGSTRYLDYSSNCLLGGMRANHQ